MNASKARHVSQNTLDIRRARYIPTLFWVNNTLLSKIKRFDLKQEDGEGFPDEFRLNVKSVYLLFQLNPLQKGTPFSHLEKGLRSKCLISLLSEFVEANSITEPC